MGKSARKHGPSGVCTPPRRGAERAGVAGNPAGARDVQSIMFDHDHGRVRGARRRGRQGAFLVKGTRWRVAATGLAMVLLAACGGTGGEDTSGEAAVPGTTVTAPERGTAPPTSGTGTAPSTSPPGGSSTPPRTAPATSKPEVTEPSSPDQKLMRLRGRIADGVEPGCVVLHAEGGMGTWLLLRTANLRLLDGRVEVTGYHVTGLLTTCQQGRPFRVVSIRAL
jgi:hypothetical protein